MSNNVVTSAEWLASEGRQVHVRALNEHADLERVTPSSL